MHCSIVFHPFGRLNDVDNKSFALNPFEKGRAILNTQLKKETQFWFKGTMHNLGSRKCKLGIKANHFKAATRKKAQEFTRKMLFTFVYHVLSYENVSARILQG